MWTVKYKHGHSAKKCYGLSFGSDIMAYGVMDGAALEGSPVDFWLFIEGFACIGPARATTGASPAGSKR